jgi:hypothetical protein
VNTTFGTGHIRHYLTGIHENVSVHGSMWPREQNRSEYHTINSRIELKACRSNSVRTSNTPCWLTYVDNEYCDLYHTKYPIVFGKLPHP